MLCVSFVRHKGLTLSGAPFGGDFIEFHTAGRILNTFGAHRLYDFQLQDDLTHEFVPDFSLPYVTPPYVAILFSPLGLLPLRLGYLIWILISTALYVGGIILLLRVEDLPRRMTLLICLAFPPFIMLVLVGGQISAIGCFILTLWIYLMRKQRPFLAGAVLGLLLYKPTLVIFIVPALVFGRQFRMLFGFAGVSSLLLLLSISMLGPAGLMRYAAILREFSTLVGLGYTPPTMYVDAATFVRRLFHVDVRYLMILLALPLTYLTRNNPERAIAPTMVFGSYAPVYDLILLVPVLLVTQRSLSRNLLAVLFVASFFTVPIAQVTGLQIITPILAFLCYELCVKPAVHLNALRRSQVTLDHPMTNAKSASEPT